MRKSAFITAVLLGVLFVSSASAGTAVLDCKETGPSIKILVERITNLQDSIKHLKASYEKDRKNDFKEAIRSYVAEVRREFASINIVLEETDESIMALGLSEYAIRDRQYWNKSLDPRLDEFYKAYFLNSRHGRGTLVARRGLIEPLGWADSNHVLDDLKSNLSNLGRLQIALTALPEENKKIDAEILRKIKEKEESLRETKELLWKILER